MCLMFRQIRQKMKARQSQPVHPKIYEVEEILDYAFFEGTPHFLIKWKNLPHDWDTWEPIYHLNSIKEYIQYWLTHKNSKLRSSLYDRADRQKNKIPGIVQTQNGIHFQHKQSKSNPNKRKNKFQIFGNKVKQQKKVFQKYCPLSTAVIDLDQDENEYKSDFPEEKNKSELEIKSSLTLKSSLNQKSLCKAKYHVKGEQISEQQQDENEQKELRCEQKEQKWDKKEKPLRMDKKEESLRMDKEMEQKPQQQEFVVVAQIDANSIKQITNHFMFNKQRCLEVVLKNGTQYDMRQNDLKIVCPEMVAHYLEERNIHF